MSNGNCSPAMSASPVPAPPQPPQRTCTRCRFAIPDNHSGQPTPNYGNANNSYTGYDGHGGRFYEEEDSACPALLEREFHSIHRNVPGLRRAGVDTNAIRQHFYPDGGWGWIVCGIAFLAHVLTTGFQLSYGLLYTFAEKHLRTQLEKDIMSSKNDQSIATETNWLGAASWAVSMFSAPVIIALCRRKSTRLTAVIGGLVLALGILFTSFATLFHQVALSYGIVVGIGATMVRESSAVMLGHYFKRRRQFVEMITMSGEGVGIALFSVILKEGVDNLKWQRGLQAVAGLMSLSFFMGLLYRPASLYHPQRRAILFMKNQRKKVKEKKTHIRTPKPPFMDFSPFKSSTVRMLIICSSIASFGSYAPLFFMSQHVPKDRGIQEGNTQDPPLKDLVLLQTFLGLSIAFGIVANGSTINKNFTISYRKINISRQYVCQIGLAMVAVSTLVISGIVSYTALCVTAWGYGLALGCYRYTLKMLALERVRAKHFTKAWGFIRCAESIPVLFGVPLTAFLNESSQSGYGRAGYFVCSASTAISAILMFFVGYPAGGRQNVSKYSANGSITSHFTVPTTDCPDLLNRSFSSRYNNWYSSGTQCTSCMSNGCSSFRHRVNFTPTHHSYGMNRCCHSNHCVNRTPMENGHGHGRLHKSLSFAFQTPMMWNDGYRTYHGAPSYATTSRAHSRCDLQRQYNNQVVANGLQHASRSRSVPEGLAHVSTQPGFECHCSRNHWRSSSFRHPNRSVQVVEQITTSV